MRIWGEDVAATEEVGVQFGADGAAATATALDDFVSDFDSSEFGASGIGANMTSFQTRLTLKSNSNTTGPQLFQIVMEYQKMPPVRWLYVFQIDVGATAITKEIRDNIIGATTKIAVKYGYEDGLSLVHIPRTQVEEKLRGMEDVLLDTSDSVWTVVLASA
jgi:hypothetical protein